MMREIPGWIVIYIPSWRARRETFRVRVDGVNLVAIEDAHRELKANKGGTVCKGGSNECRDKASSEAAYALVRDYLAYAVDC